MDGLKLEHWKENFLKEVKNIQIEYDAFFKTKRLEDYYQLLLDESHEWGLEISEELPREIQERLLKLLVTTKPEDSI